MALVSISLLAKNEKLCGPTVTLFVHCGDYLMLVASISTPPPAKRRRERESVDIHTHKTLIFDADVTLDKNGKFREFSLLGVERICKNLTKISQISLNPRYH